MSAELPTRIFPASEVIREIARLAALDDRRGIDYWFDGDLTDLLREVRSGRTAVASGGSAFAVRIATRAARARRASRDRNRWPRMPHQLRRRNQRRHRIDRVSVSTRSHRPSVSTGTSVRTGVTTSTSTSTSTSPQIRSGSAGQRERDTELGSASSRHRSRARLGRAAAALGGQGRGLSRSVSSVETRNKVVFGVGSASVPLVFVGEAPGADEDREALPLSGRSRRPASRQDHPGHRARTRRDLHL